MRYKRQINPSFILPPDLVRGFYERDAEALSEASSWVEKNGMFILMTYQYVSGDETAWVDEAEGKIYVGTKTLPKRVDMRRWLTQIDPALTRLSISQEWTNKNLFEELSKHIIGGGVV